MCTGIYYICAHAPYCRNKLPRTKPTLDYHTTCDRSNSREGYVWIGDDDNKEANWGHCWHRGVPKEIEWEIDIAKKRGCEKCLECAKRAEYIGEDYDDYEHERHVERKKRAKEKKKMEEKSEYI